MAVAVDVANGQNVAEARILTGLAADAVPALPPRLDARRCQPARGAAQDDHPTRAADLAHILADPDHKVGVPVAVEVARGQAVPEHVVLLIGPGNPRPSLVPRLVPGGQARGAAVQHLNRPSVLLVADVLEGNPDRQIGVPIGVKIPGGQRVAEEVTPLERALHPLAALMPHLIPRRHTGCGPVEHLHRPDITFATKILTRHPDRQVGVAVSVEVEGHHRMRDRSSGINSRRCHRWRDHTTNENQTHTDQQCTLHKATPSHIHLTRFRCYSGRLGPEVPNVLPRGGGSEAPDRARLRLPSTAARTPGIAQAC